MKLGKKEMAARISQYQELYKGKVLYFTEDGNCFTSKSPAVDHARKSGIKWMEVAPQGSAAADAEPKGVPGEGKKAPKGDAADVQEVTGEESGKDDPKETEKPE